MSKEEDETFENGYIKGAMQSIDKTTREIELILKGESLDDVGKFRQALRQKIEQSLTELSEKWYKKGFNRGHKEVYLQYIKTGKIRKSISLDVSRRLLPKSKSKIALRSTLKKEFISKYTK